MVCALEHRRHTHAHLQLLISFCCFYFCFSGGEGKRGKGSTAVCGSKRNPPVAVAVVVAVVAIVAVVAVVAAVAVVAGVAVVAIVAGIETEASRNEKDGGSLASINLLRVRENAASAEGIVKTDQLW